MFRARRVSVGPTQVQAYDWSGGGGRVGPIPPPAPAAPTPVPQAPASDPVAERNAFLEGYAQGERAGADAAAKRSDATLRKLSTTIEELGQLRTDIIQRTERQMVQLALSIARRIVQREISLDRSLLVAMARVAVERLGGHASATIRLHPDDYAAIVAGLSAESETPHVQVVADPAVQRGGCLVDSDFGFMDVSPDAQFDELARRLLEDPAPPPELRLDTHGR